MPTLTSVERIVDKLASLGIVLTESSELDRIAKLVNTHFLTVAPANWVDTSLRLNGEVVGSRPERSALDAIKAVRLPALGAASAVLMAQARGDGALQRIEETRLVDRIGRSAIEFQPVWESWPGMIASFLGRTVLEPLVTGLVGVPIIDIVRFALAGIGKIV